MTRSRTATSRYLPEAIRCIEPETAECLGITEENVKVRLFRARALLHRQLIETVGAASSDAFQFLGARCDRIVQRVMERINRVSES